MSAKENAWEMEEWSIDRNRFLEYTVSSIAEKFRSLDDEVIALLQTYPALFTYEKMLNRPASVGWITSVRRLQNDLLITFKIDSDYAEIDFQDFEKLSNNLDISKPMELHRTHWALKDVDLLNVLKKYKIVKRENKKSGDDKLKRGVLVAACRLLKTMSHADFDDFILEIGVDELIADRSVGSRQVRAAKIAEFVVKHPEIETADGEPMAVLIVNKAKSLDVEYPDGSMVDVTDKERENFWSLLNDEGEPEKSLREIKEEGSRSGGFYKKEIRGESVNTGSKVINENKKVFIVHGRSEGPRESVSRLIEKIGLIPIILHEQVNSGRTIFDKFQKISEEVAFAIVLMTPEDEGRLAGEDGAQLRRRARQNVIFEMGYFIGKIGARNVCSLFSGDIEEPTDIGSVVYIKYGPNTNWKELLIKELKGAGMSIDTDKMFDPVL